MIGTRMPAPKLSLSLSDFGRSQPGNLSDRRSSAPRGRAVAALSHGGSGAVSQRQTDIGWPNVGSYLDLDHESHRLGQVGSVPGGARRSSDWHNTASLTSPAVAWPVRRIMAQELTT